MRVRRPAPAREWAPAWGTLRGKESGEGVNWESGRPASHARDEAAARRPRPLCARGAGVPPAPQRLLPVRRVRACGMALLQRCARAASEELARLRASGFRSGSKRRGSRSSGGGAHPGLVDARAFTVAPPPLRACALPDRVDPSLLARLRGDALPPRPPPSSHAIVAADLRAFRCSGPQARTARQAGRNSLISILRLVQIHPATPETAGSAAGRTSGKPPLGAYGRRRGLRPRGA
jgi:hypothetical protein